MSRKVTEWQGKTDDTAIPPRVRLRVFEAHNGICQETGRKITPADKWDCDHTIALANGGENRESNLRPLLRAAHRDKTKTDVQLKAKIARVRKKHLGLEPKTSTFPGSKGSKWKRTVGGRAVLREE